MLPRAASLIALVVGLSFVALALVGRAEADHDYYQYKFPCKPNDICHVTTLAHTGNAFDFDPLGSAGLGDIAAVSEGTFQGYIAAQTTCTSSGLGQHAVIADVFGRTMLYAHLSQFGDLVVGQKVYQGDIVGVEGNTGNTSGNPQNPCAPHLHLQGISTVPGIDGHSLASVGLTSYYSSNSRIGNHTAIPDNFTVGSQAIRDIYKFLALYGLSWATFGWTADWTGSQSNCYSGTYCQYYVHYTPHEQNGHWGLRQTFRLHPGTAVYDDGAIMVGRWWGPGNPPTPYWVKPGFFFTWLFNKQGPPLANDLPSPSLFCHSGNSCAAYQRYSVGYVWRNTSGVWSSVLCADYTGDYSVKIGDIQLAVQQYFHDDPGPQYEPWANSRIDVDGNGLMRLDEITAALDTYFDNCIPPTPP